MEAALRRLVRLLGDTDQVLACAGDVLLLLQRLGMCFYQLKRLALEQQMLSC